MEWQQFMLLVLGAIVSGIVGIFTVLWTGRMRDRRWVRENIIRPLYNEVNHILVSGTHEIDDKFRSFWFQLDSYAKLNIDRKLTNNLDDYTDEIAHLQAALKRYEEIKQKTISTFKDAVRRAMANNLTDDGNSIWLEQHKGSSSSVDIGAWLNMFLEVLVSHKDEYSLTNALITKSENSHWGHEKYFRLWQSQRPSVFVDLAREFRSTEMPEEYNHALEEVQRFRQQLVSRTESLRGQLLEKGKKHW